MLQISIARKLNIETIKHYKNQSNINTTKENLNTAKDSNNKLKEINMQTHTIKGQQRMALCQTATKERT